MSREELLAKLSLWIGEITEAPSPALSEDTDLSRDLGLDSIALAELASRVRRELQVRLRVSEVAQDLSVRHLLELVELQRK